MKNKIETNLEKLLTGRTGVKENLIGGVYLLFDGDKMVYVGQSMRCHSRIEQHIKAGQKKFDSYKIIECAETNRVEIEMQYFLEFFPKYNKKPPCPPRQIPHILLSEAELWERKKEIPFQEVTALLAGGKIYIFKKDVTFINS